MGRLSHESQGESRSILDTLQDCKVKRVRGQERDEEVKVKRWEVSRKSYRKLYRKL
jgi:hypothetical protein